MTDLPPAERTSQGIGLCPTARTPTRAARYSGCGKEALDAPQKAHVGAELVARTQVTATQLGPSPRFVPKTSESQ